jgi:hypothetical protein
MRLGCTALLCLTTMREVAHIMLSGNLPRMPQHASVISGTSTVVSISGKIISATGSAGTKTAQSSGNKVLPKDDGAGLGTTRAW